MTIIRSQADEYQVQGRSLKQLSLAATPDNIAAILELDEKIDSLSYTKELLQVAIPGAGIPVSGIFSLGATVAYEVGFSTTFKGIASSNYGVLGSLRNSTGVSIDAVTSSNSVANGFNAPINLQPIFNLASLTADVVVAAFSQPKLNLWRRHHPDWTLRCWSCGKAAGYNASSFCDTTPRAPTAGASITGQWDI